jgi:tetratricopeptide (TPR) repeat protein
MERKFSYLHAGTLAILLLALIGCNPASATTSGNSNSSPNNSSSSSSTAPEASTDNGFIAGSVFEEGLIPAEGAIVTVVGESQTAVVDANGNFSVGNLPEKLLTINITFSCYDTYSYDVDLSKNRIVNDIFVELFPNCNNPAADATLTDEEMAESLYQSGVHKYYSGDPTASFDAYDTFSYAIELDPNHAGAYLYRGIIAYLDLNDPNAALGDVSKALQLDSSNPDAYYWYGVVNYSLGIDQEAGWALTEYLDLDTGDNDQTKDARSILEAIGY